MAEISNQSSLKADDDEDLFVSAYESNNRSIDVKSVEQPAIKNDIISGAAMHAIDLNDDEPIETKSPLPSIHDPFTPTPLTADMNDDTIDNHAISNGEKATLDASCVTASSPSEAKMTSVYQDARSTNQATQSLSDLPTIKVGSPQKLGDGMGAFVVFQVVTEGTRSFFFAEKLGDLTPTTFIVMRRFSDFLGLRDKLAEKYLHCGYIVPPAPAKDAVGTAKVIMSKDEFCKDFLEKRAAALERFLNRVLKHNVLRNDSSFREFLTFEDNLPKSKNTSAFSGASFVRMFNKVGKTVNKITFRMDESEPWFEEKQSQIENLDNQLRKLHASVEALIHHRKELIMATSLFANSAAMLGNREEHTALSCALSKLAETEEKIENLITQQANSDFYYLSELLHDYIDLIGVVKEVFEQRVRVYQMWQNAEQMLNKKREAKTKLELAGKTDKVSAALREVIEWEAKVLNGEKEFGNISKNIKKEVEEFELNRINDFKNNIVKYLESLFGSQEQMIKHWEAFLPTAREISPST